MSFKTRQIRKKPPLPLRSGMGSQFLFKIKNTFKQLFSANQTGQRSTLRKVWILLVLILASWLVIRLSLFAYGLITDPKKTLEEAAVGVAETFSTELKTDDNGYTNIVLLGDGGYRREGAGLVDVIQVASIDHEKNAVTLLSIPRDYYYLDTQYAKQNPTGFGIGKINEVFLAYTDRDFSEEGYGAYQGVVGDIANLDIHYFVRVDFNAFVEIVDSMGGITVDVPYDIYDYTYPNATDTGFDPFIIESGAQQIDGETALKYVRSRHTTSDFERSARQQQVLGALQEKALSAAVLTRPNTLKDLYDSVQSNMNTNMSWQELLSLATFAAEFDRSNLVMKGLNNDWLFGGGTEGGFLGDGDQDVYGGAVLVPYTGDLDRIHQYADLIFNHREVYFDVPKVQILNATKTTGLAGDARYELNHFGFNVVDIGNYLGPDGQKQYVEETMLIYYSWAEDGEEVIPTYGPYIDVLNEFLPFTALPGDIRTLEEDIDLTLVLGEDYEALNLK